MRWATFQTDAGEERVGVLSGSEIRALEPGVSLLRLLEQGTDALFEAGEAVLRNPIDVYPLEGAFLLAPLPRPPSVRDFYAFEQHVRTARERRGLEMDPDWYQLPVFYFSNPAAIVGPFEDVAIPPGTSQLDFELQV